MNRWSVIRADYADWLRLFPMLSEIGQPGNCPEIVSTSADPAKLEFPFWSERTREIEARALLSLTDLEIDGIFDEVASVIDENLVRFDPLVEYYGRFAPDGDPCRIEAERAIAHSVKRDLAWAAIEKSIGEPGFFCGLQPWYDRGRWPCGWVGKFPDGHLRVT